jgi:acyl-CoA dehydrogenase
VGGVNEGWKVAMGLLSFERGASTLAQQFAFARELEAIVERAKATGRADDPRWRQRLAALHSRLAIMRWNTMRTLTRADRPELSREAYVGKLYWARLHRDLGEAFLDVLGPDGLRCEPGKDPASVVPSYALTPAQRLFLFTRADTIYGGSDQIQRNIIGERALGLPPEPKG